MCKCLKDYGSCDLEKYIDGDKVTTAHLGMGVSETWRGVPDGRVRGFSINSEIPLLIGRKSGGAGSNGTTTTCKAKLKINKKNLGQLVKTIVVASFIENNLHPELSAMVPAILLDTSKAVVALYCAEHGLSETFNWRNKTCFSIPGISLLWAMFNHRYEVVTL